MENYQYKPELGYVPADEPTRDLQRDFALHLEFLLWPRERVLYQEQPARIKAIRRNAKFITLSLVVFIFVPLSTIVYGTLTCVEYGWEGVWMFGLLLVDAPFVAFWVLWFRTFNRAYVVTDQRTLLLRTRPLPSETLTQQEGTHAELGRENGYEIIQYKDGSAQMTSGNIKFELVSAGSQLQDALEQGLPPPLYRAEETSKFLLVLYWIVRVAMISSVCVIFTVLVPVGVRVAVVYHHNYFSAMEGSDARIFPLDDSGFLYSVLVVMVVCLVVTVVAVTFVSGGVVRIVDLKTDNLQELDDRAVKFFDERPDEEDEEKLINAGDSWTDDEIVPAVGDMPMSDKEMGLAASGSLPMLSDIDEEDAIPF